jgi:hypothetical protein
MSGRSWTGMRTNGRPDRLTRKLKTLCMVKGVREKGISAL